MTCHSTPNIVPKRKYLIASKRDSRAAVRSEVHVLWEDRLFPFFLCNRSTVIQRQRQKQGVSKDEMKGYERLKCITQRRER